MNIRRQSITFQFEEDPFSKNVQSLVKIYLSLLLLMNFLQTKLQVKNLNVKYYDLYYTVIKNRDKKIVENKNENNDNIHINYEDFIISNQKISNKPRETILK